MTDSTLLVDIGNSKTGLADYGSGHISKTRWLDTAIIQSSAPFEGYVRIVVSSVVPDLDHFLPGHAQFITHQNIPNLTINLSSPNEVGADRIVNALAAYSGQKRSCLVVDSGTATTFCYVTQSGVYEGGAIFPGLKMSSQALNDHTAKIPLIWVEPQPRMYGKNTEQAVQVGLYHGFIAMINGMIAQYRQLDPLIWVVGTGNGLSILKDQLKLDAYDPDLIFKGLAVCAEKTNRP